MWTHLVDHLWRSNAVSQTNRSHTVDLGKRSCDDHWPTFQNMRNSSLIIRVLDEMMVSLVDQDRYILRNTVQQFLHVTLIDDNTRRVVWIHQVDQPDITIIFPGGFNHRIDVLSCICVQWKCDDVCLQACSMAINRAIGRLYTNDFLVCT